MTAPDKLTELNQLKLRRAELKQKLLNAKAESSRNYHQFLLTGKRTDPLQRAELAASIASMEAELFHMDRQISAFEGIRLKLRANTVLRHLNALLSERGLGAVMDEAHARLRAAEQEVNHEAATVALSLA